MRFQNQMHDRYNPGTDLTCHATTAVTGKTFATIAGPMDHGLINVTTATNGGPVAGVFKYDQDANQTVGVARGSSRVVTVTADGPITAGSPVVVGSSGKATAYSAPDDSEPAALIVGYAVDTVDDGDDTPVSLAN